MRRSIAKGSAIHTSRSVHLWFKEEQKFFAVPWGTREQGLGNEHERFWTCGPLLIGCQTNWQAPWVKEEPPAFSAGECQRLSPVVNILQRHRIIFLFE